MLRELQLVGQCEFPNAIHLLGVYQDDPIVWQYDRIYKRFYIKQFFSSDLNRLPTILATLQCDAVVMTEDFIVSIETQTKLEISIWKINSHQPLIPLKLKQLCAALQTSDYAQNNYLAIPGSNLITISTPVKIFILTIPELDCLEIQSTLADIFYTRSELIIFPYKWVAQQGFSKKQFLGTATKYQLDALKRKIKSPINIPLAKDLLQARSYSATDELIKRIYQQNLSDFSGSDFAMGFPYLNKVILGRKEARPQMAIYDRIKIFDIKTQSDEYSLQPVSKIEAIKTSMNYLYIVGENFDNKYSLAQYRLPNEISQSMPYIRLKAQTNYQDTLGHELQWASEKTPLLRWRR